MTTGETGQQEGEATFSHRAEEPDSDEKREKREKIVAANIERLAQRRELGEIAEKSIGLYEIYDLGNPLLTRELVGNKAIVLTQEDLADLGGIQMLMDNGDIIDLDPRDNPGYSPDEQIVIWPEDLG